MEAFAASGRAPRGPVNGDDELEREFVAGECESVRFVTKTKSGKHLRMRRGTVELMGETAAMIGHQSGRIMGRRCELNCEWKGRGKGSAVGLIGERVQ